MSRRAPRPLVALLGVLLAACGAPTAPLPEHPLGAACTWPSELDAQRDRFAVLGASTDAADVLVLLDVATGGVVARCAGVRRVVARPEFTAAGYHPGPPSAGSVVLSPVSPDLRRALVPGGVVELASGRVVPDPGPTWTAAAFPGGGSVLRMHADRHPPTLPRDWCVAPRPDSPQLECRSLSGSGPGVPVPHGDGTVGWADGTPVPADFGGLRGVVQTDGRGVVQARLNDSTQADGTRTLLDGSLRAGVFDAAEVRFARGVAADRIDRPSWFTLAGAGPERVTAALHTAPVVWTDVRWDPVAANREAGPYGAAVVADGRSVVLVMRGRTAGIDEAGSGLAARVVVVGEDGSVREAVRIPVGPAAPLPDLPRILVWPDPAPSTQP